MLPRGPLGRQQLGNLRVYKGADHPHAAQQPEPLDIAALNRKNVRTPVMAETLQTLQPADLKGRGRAARPRPQHVQKLDAQGRAYATGKRKDAVARVWIKPGAGKITVNEPRLEVYFARPVLRMMIQQPLVSRQPRRTSTTSSARSPAAASPARPARCATALSKALTYYEPELRAVLKKGGFLTRDPRVVERKKYGKPRPAAASSSRSANCKGPPAQPARQCCCRASAFRVETEAPAEVTVGAWPQHRAP